MRSLLLACVLLASPPTGNVSECYLRADRHHQGLCLACEHIEFMRVFGGPGVTWCACAKGDGHLAGAKRSCNVRITAVDRWDRDNDGDVDLADWAFLQRGRQ